MTTPSRSNAMFHSAKQTALPNTARKIQLMSAFGCVKSGARFGMPSTASISGTAVTNAQNMTRRVTTKLSIRSE